jgi:hypothetical protein
MGNQSSVQLQDTLSSSVQKSLNESISNVKNNVSNNSKISQDINVSLTKVSMVGCNLIIKQEAKTDASVMANFSSEISDKMSTDLTSLVNKTLEAESLQKASGFSIANVSSLQSTKNRTFNNNDLKTIIQKSIDNNISSNADQIQKIKISMEDSQCKNGNITIDQNAVIKSVATGITNAILESASANKALTSEELKVKQKATQIVTGSLGAYLIIVVVFVIGIFAYCKFTNGCILTLWQKVGLGILVLLIIAVIITILVLVNKKKDKKKEDDKKDDKKDDAKTT